MTTAKKVLVVEDDGAVREMIAAYLTNAGYVTLSAADGHAMQAALEGQVVDLVLLDLGLPDGDGLELLRQIRRRSRLGIIVVTSRDAPEDRALGLEIGADDYVTKPFFPRELLARVRNVLNRHAAGGGNAALRGVAMERFAGWTLDRDGRQVIAADGTRPALTPAEFDVLAYLVANPQVIIPRDLLADQISDRRGANPGGRAIDILISRLRAKLGDDRGDDRLIETVRGRGYRFAATVTEG
ncbi:response regulator [Novispirillum sp. DQ9]|uniref:response regulator n=1 Tax=Novispirillum sp. DQ9 TaxID=3398612 RepID=UPI003C7AEEF1